MAKPKIPLNEIYSRAFESAEKLMSQLEKLSPGQKAGVLIMTNQFLNIASRTWGRDVREDPRLVSQETLHTCLSFLAETRDKTLTAVKWQGVTGAGIRQIIATDIAFMTIAYALFPDLEDRMYEVWRYIWKSRQHLNEALLDIRDWEEEYKIEAVPRNQEGKRQTDEEIIKSGLSFPLFMKKRKPPEEEMR